MGGLGLTLVLALGGGDLWAGPAASVLEPRPSPSVLDPLPLAVAPVPRPMNCTPAVIVGAATMVVSAAVFARGWVDKDDALRTGGAVGETIGAAVLIFGVSRPTCL